MIKLPLKGIERLVEGIEGSVQNIMLIASGERTPLAVCVSQSSFAGHDYTFLYLIDLVAMRVVGDMVYRYQLIKSLEYDYVGLVRFDSSITINNQTTIYTTDLWLNQFTKYFKGIDIDIDMNSPCNKDSWSKMDYENLMAVFLNKVSLYSQLDTLSTMYGHGIQSDLRAIRVLEGRLFKDITDVMDIHKERFACKK